MINQIPSFTLNGVAGNGYLINLPDEMLIVSVYSIGGTFMVKSLPSSSVISSPPNSDPTPTAGNQSTYAMVVDGSNVNYGKQYPSSVLVFQKTKQLVVWCSVNGYLTGVAQ